MAMVTPPDNSSLYKSEAGYRKVMAHYDTALQSMGIPYEGRYVETRYGATHAVVSGNENGKSIVLWHGGNANAASWVPWITALAPTYHLHAIDTIGDMGKSAPSRPPKGGSAYGQWAADALQGLGLKQANMIGISNGGWLILKLGGVAPERIGSAVLMSSAGFRPISKMFVLRFVILSLLFRSPAEVARRFLTMLEPPGAPPPGPEALELFALIMGGYRLGPQYTCEVQALHHTHTIPAQAILNVSGPLSDVDVKAHIQSVRRFDGPGQRFFMRRYGRSAEVLERRDVGVQEADDADAEAAALDDFVGGREGLVVGTDHVNGD